VILIVLLNPRRGAAAATEHLDSDRPEAWAMNYFTSLSLLAGLGPPYSRKPGSFDVGLEIGWIPELSASQRRVGFNGTKEEDLNKAPIFARPRLTIALPWSSALTLAYVPPIQLFGVTPNLFAFGVERPIYDRRPWTVGLRAYGQIGDVEGAFTCPREAARARPGSQENPLGCQGESSDTATQHYGGLELTGAYRLEQARGLTPYVAVAGNFLDTRLQVDALELGVRDRTRLAASTWTFSATGGFVYPVGDKMRLSIGAFYSPLWVRRPPATGSELDGVLNVRGLVTYQLSWSTFADIFH
jgi:hypothetical protein